MEALKKLFSYDQFIIYKKLFNSEKNKYDKIPLNSISLIPHSVTDAGNYLTYQKAYSIFSGLNSEEFGIGFCFTENDPFFFIDIDNCISDGKYNQIASDILTEFKGAAVELSTSKKGIHIFGCGSINNFDNKNNQFGLEFYTEKRFVALTFAVFGGDVSLDFTSQLNWLADKYLRNSQTGNVSLLDWTDAPHGDWKGPENDDELIRRALSSKPSGLSILNGKASFSDLWQGNFEVLEQAYSGDKSAYDAALVQHLAFWTGGNCERIQTLLFKSGLVRDKYDREDYIQKTILKACARQKEYYCEKPAAEIIESLVENPVITTSGDGYLSLEQQLELFRGCIYICDDHKIITKKGDLLKEKQFKVMFGGYSFPMDISNRKITRNAWEAFTESQLIKWPKVDSKTFKPLESPGAIIKKNNRSFVNTYYPADVIMKPGNCDLFLNHLRKILPDEKDQNILLAYLAACVQYKGEKFQWAPLLQGVDGNGKTVFNSCVAYAVGEQYTHSPRASEIHNKFNNWMYGKLFIAVEDICVSKSKLDVIEILKPMITSKRQAVEPKGSDQTTVDICCNFIFNTNHKDGLRKSYTDRRIAPFYTAQQSPDDLIRDGLDKKYYIRLYGWLEKDGYANVAHFLQTYKIPDQYGLECLKGNAPQTSSTTEALCYGYGAIEQEIIEAVEQSEIGFRGGFISTIMLNNLLEKLGLARYVSRYKRKEVLKSLGYITHPALIGGRVNSFISMPDNGKPHLYVKVNSEYLNITEPAIITQYYISAQQNSD